MSIIYPLWDYYAILKNVKLFTLKDNNYKNIINFAAMLVLLVLLACSVPIFHYVADVIELQALAENATYLYAPYSCVQVSAAVFSFLFFIRLEFYNKYLNIIAGTMMGVFLIHEHLLLRGYIWKIRFPYMSSALGNAVVLIFCVFVVSILIEAARQKVFELIKGAIGCKK